MKQLRQADWERLKKPRERSAFGVWHKGCIQYDKEEEKWMGNCC